MNMSTLTSSTTGLASTAASTLASSTTQSQTLTENDFLQLLITQLQNQDPLNPMDTSQFTSELAQFSSLEQLTNLNTAIGNLTTNENVTQNAIAAGLIGTNVEVSGNQVSLSGSANINFTLAGAAAQTNLSIYNASGQCVRQVALGAESAGNVTYAWDGTDGQGTTLPNGQYTFSVTAANASGASVSATTLTTGTVTGVTFQNNTTYLVLDNGSQVLLSSVQEISQ